MTARFLVGDVFDRLAELEDESVDLVVTSPPFLALRSYLPADHPDKDREIGSEATPAEFIDVMLGVSAELRRVLAPYGSICIELGDTYAGSGGAGGDYLNAGLRDGQPPFDGSASRGRAQDREYEGGASDRWDFAKPGTNSRLASGDGWPLAKSKALIAEMYRIGLAYGINPLTGQPSPAGRWRIRNVVTWVRPNPPVGALGDKWRPATSDLVIACTSGKRYWDDLATRRTVDPYTPRNTNGPKAKVADHSEVLVGFDVRTDSNAAGAPLLDWWEIPPGGYKGSHYAVYPEELVIPCVQAMCPPKVCRTCGEPSRRIIDTDRVTTSRPDKTKGPVWEVSPKANTGAFADRGVTTVHHVGWSDCGHDNWRPGLILDPFAGSGTTLAVATGYGHDAIGIDLDQRNAELALQRVGPFLLEVEA